MIGTFVWTALLGLGQGNIESEVAAILTRAGRPNEGDEERIKALGDRAFVFVYPFVKKQVMSPDALSYDGREGRRRQRLSYLLSCATMSRTTEMTVLYDLAQSFNKDWIFNWLANTGDAKANRALFEKGIGEDVYGSVPTDAAMGLARIGDERAVQTISAQLSRPEVKLGSRRQFAVILAGLGKPSALASVRKVLHKGRTIPKLLERTKLPTDEGDSQVFQGIETDKTGTKRALIHWDVLGAPDDLWIVRWSGTQWVDPIFTGVSSHWPMIYPAGGRVQEGYEAHQKEMAELIERKGWLTRFVGNPVLIKDSDGDGLTDVVETWLGLNPDKADSDGDGLSDDVDKNPLAKPRAMSDEENAMQAAMNLYCLSDYEPNRNQIIGFPNGIEPFEVDSCNGAVYLQEPPKGVAKATGKVFGNWFTVNRAEKVNVTEYTVSLVESGGFYTHFLEVTVRKFNNEWFSTRIRLRGSAVS